MRRPYLALALLVAVAAGSRPAAADVDGNPGTGRVPAFTGEGGIPAPLRESPIVFFDRDAFLASAGRVRTENFERVPVVGDCDSGGVALIPLDDFTATSQPAALKILRDECFGAHNTTPGGKRFLAADTDTADVSAEVTFEFELPLTAFGTYLVDLDIAPMEITVLGSNWEVPPTGEGGEAYFGILSSTPFSIVTFRIPTGTDTNYSVDDVAYALPGSGPVGVGGGVAALDWGRVKSSYR